MYLKVFSANCAAIGFKIITHKTAIAIKSKRRMKFKIEVLLFKLFPVQLRAVIDIRLAQKIVHGVKWKPICTSAFHILAEPDATAILVQLLY